MADCGFYGKLPSQGDFVSRRLPWEFTSVWDDWLQQGLQASRAALGPRWLEVYLSAPVWRFQVAPGVCGPQGWRGLFFASVDRVGRYFPLTLAVADAAADRPALATLSGGEAQWLAAEDCALAALDPKLAIDAFDLDVQRLELPPAAAPDDAAGAPAFCLYTIGSETIPPRGHAFAALPPPAQFAALLAIEAASPEPSQ
jgi:type VI secretion system protein ImpM